MKKLVILFVLIFPFFLRAQMWTGANSEDWNDSGNWSVSPQNGDGVVIDPANYSGNAFHPSIVSASIFVPSTIDVLNGGQLTILDNLSTSDDVRISNLNSKVTLQSGVFSVNSFGNGRLIATNGASVSVNNGTLNAGKHVSAETNASIEINGGEVTTNQRLLAALGGSIIQNDGIVNVGESAIVSDGDANFGSSKIAINGGTINITGNIHLESNIANFDPRFAVNGGTVNVVGDVFWLGISPGLGRPSFVMSGGETNVSGNIFNSVGSTVGLDLRIAQNSVLNFSGSSIKLIYPTDSIIQTGATKFNIFDTNAISNEGGFNAAGGLIKIHGTTTLYGDGGSYQLHDLTITSSGNLAHITPSFIKLGGDFQNDGIFNHALNQLVLNGQNQQIISGNSITTFSRLSISNAMGVLMNQSFNIRSLLNLNLGIIYNPVPFKLIILDNASSTEGSALSFVDGPIIKIGDDEFVFPTGNVTSENLRYWARIKISAPQDNTSQFTAYYKAESFTNISDFNSPLNLVSGAEYWSLIREQDSSNLRVTLYWENADSSSISNCNQLSVASWNGSTWNNYLGAVTGACTGNNTGQIQTLESVNEFNFFTFGDLGEVTTQEIVLCSGDSTSVGLNTYASTGVFLDVLSDQFGNDSTVISTINVLNPIVENENFTLCFGDSIELNGIFHGMTSTVENIYIASSGCDSSVISTISILDQIFVDSLINLCAGESISINGQTYNSSATVSETFASQVGCDSLVNYTIQFYSPVNVDVNQSGSTLSSQNTNAFSYQWINCETNAAIPNETNSSFTFTVNGSVKLAVTDANNCIDTSACFTLNNLTVDKLNTQDLISISPNPSSSIFHIVGIDQKKIKNMEVIDNTGKTCWKQNGTDSHSTSIDLSNLEVGIYQLIIQTDKTQQFKIVKE